MTKEQLERFIKTDHDTRLRIIQEFRNNGVDERLIDLLVEVDIFSSKEVQEAIFNKVYESLKVK